MNKKISTPIAIGIILILSVSLIVFTYWQVAEIDKSAKQTIEVKVSEKKEVKDETADLETYFPSQPTQQEREDAKKIPKDQCPCWDGVDNICLPQADCI